MRKGRESVRIDLHRPVDRFTPTRGYQVVTNDDESHMKERGVGEMFGFAWPMRVKSIMMVGYGNTINDWNR